VTTPARRPASPVPVLAALGAGQREQAMARFAVLRPHLEEGVPLARAADEADVAARTAQRWLARYRAGGLAGLARTPRADAGCRRLPAGLVALIEGLALRKPQPTVAAIHRRALAAAQAQGWPAPCYGSVYAIVRGLDPAMVTLAQQGQPAFRDRFELVFRHRASRPNALWQADHTELDILVLDADGAAARPWLTTVIDDYSRAVAGYSVFLAAPSALHTSLALRQAIWRKADSAWPVCGIPDVLYVDHGSDFTSTHLSQVAADLRIELVYSAAGRPQGRGKVERLFGTLNTELLPELPGHLAGGRPVTPPRLSLPELDAAVGGYITGTYHVRPHRETGTPPVAAWAGDGWLPRMPASLDELDLLLVMVATPRTVHRDGIHFQGLRYLAPTLAAYAREPVTIRYDPRDITEIRVFHRNRFLCRAISPEHAGETITLKDLQAARAAHRRALRGQISQRLTAITDYLPGHAQGQAPPAAAAAPRPAPGSRLRTYREDTR
jgi:putative transposase